MQQAILLEATLALRKFNRMCNNNKEVMEEARHLLEDMVDALVRNKVDAVDSNLEDSNLEEGSKPTIWFPISTSLTIILSRRSAGGRSQ